MIVFGSCWKALDSSRPDSTGTYAHIGWVGSPVPDGLRRSSKGWIMQVFGRVQDQYEPKRHVLGCSQFRVRACLGGVAIRH